MQHVLRITQGFKAWKVHIITASERADHDFIDEIKLLIDAFLAKMHELANDLGGYPMCDQFRVLRKRY